MNNFEKFKKELTIDKLMIFLDDACIEECCHYCAYNSQTCSVDCEYGIKKWLESEVE